MRSFERRADKFCAYLGATTARTIVQFSVNPCGPHASAYGCNQKANPHQIEIAERLVKQFESDAAKGRDNNSRGTLVYIVGATILHELCHWGNYQAGVAETKEMGEEFEKAIYRETIW